MNEELKRRAEEWRFKDFGLVNTRELINDLLAECERLDALVNENEGAFKVWRRRCEEAESRIAELEAMLAAAPEPPATQTNVRDAGPTPFAGRAAGTRREPLNSDATWPHEIGP